MNPSSCASTANTKSLSWTGRNSPRVCVPLVRPVPRKPPEPTVICAWATCQPAPCVSALGLRNDRMRSFW